MSEKGLTTAFRIERLTAATQRMVERTAVEERLGAVSEAAAELTGARRASTRLLDPARTQLIAAGRFGPALHQQASTVFTVGEGLVGWVAQALKPLRTGDADHDPRFKARGDMKEPMGSFLGAPMVAGSACVGVLSVVERQPNFFDGNDERFLLLLATMAAPHLEVARLSLLSPVDPLTRLPQGAALDERLEAAPPGELSVGLINVDRLAFVNERLGTAVGDEVLRSVAEQLVRHLGDRASLFRSAGGEFVALLAVTSLQPAKELLETACRAIARTPAKAAPGSVSVTVSAGVVARRPDESPGDLLLRLRGALRAAKEAGRDAVVAGP